MNHFALGLGVYCAFQNMVSADDAIEAPSATHVNLPHMVTVWLDGAAGSSISHVIGTRGAAVNMGSRKATLLY